MLGTSFFFARANEKLHLHLLELAHPKMNWRATISFPKGFTDRAIPKEFSSVRFLHIQEVYKIPARFRGADKFCLRLQLLNPSLYWTSNWIAAHRSSARTRNRTNHFQIFNQLLHGRHVALPMAAFNRALVSSIFFDIPARALVVTNVSLLKASPKRLAAFSTSLLNLIFHLGDGIFNQNIGTVAFLESLLSIIGSLKASTWPLAFHVVGCIK